MASSVPCCSICEHRQTSIPAKVWCQECEEALCEDCHQHHDLSKISKFHETIQISKYIELPSLIHEIKQFCQTHGEKFQTYCKVHDCPCCRKCIIKNHSECKYLVCLEDVIHNAKVSSVFTELEHSLVEQGLNIENIIDDREGNIQELSSEKERIKSKVQSMKKSIIEHLDKLEESIIKDLNDVENENKTKITQLLEKLCEKNKIIVNTQKTLDKIKEHASNLQTFLATKQIEDEVNANDKFLSSLFDSNSLKWTHLTFNFQPEITTFMSRVQNLGQIKVDESQTEVKLERKKEKQAQLLLPIALSSSVNDITLQLKMRLSTTGRDIRGLTVQPDGKILFTDYDNFDIKCINNDGTTELRLTAAKGSFDIELLEENIVAVSGGKKISLLDLQSKSITKTYTLPSWVYGITARDGKLLCSCWRKAIQVVDLSSGSLSTIDAPTCPISPYSYIKTFGDNIYYTDPDKNIVVCCDMKGKIIWKFHDDTILKYPTGIDVDKNGFIYVIGTTTCNVVVISADGQQNRQLLTQKNGLKRPQAIFHDMKNNELLIANRNNYIFRYRFEN